MTARFGSYRLSTTEFSADDGDGDDALFGEASHTAFGRVKAFTQTSLYN